MTDARDGEVPVVDLSLAPGGRDDWGRSRIVVFSWGVMELLFVSNPLQVSSRLRIAVLRAYGARIGSGVIFRPRTRVKYPWRLVVGDRTWIGEGVWFHNQASIKVGSDVVISQETFLTTGSHAHRRDMGLLTKPIHIKDGAWVTSRCMVLGGCTIGRSALVGPMTLVASDVADNEVVRSPQMVRGGRRFEAGGDSEN